MSLQQPGAAASRFYRAFYRWTVLTSSTPQQWHHPPSHAASFRWMGRGKAKGRNPLVEDEIEEKSRPIKVAAEGIRKKMIKEALRARKKVAGEGGKTSGKTPEKQDEARQQARKPEEHSRPGTKTEHDKGAKTRLERRKDQRRPIVQARKRQVQNERSTAANAAYPPVQPVGAWYRSYAVGSATSASKFDDEEPSEELVNDKPAKKRRGSSPRISYHKAASPRPIIASRSYLKDLPIESVKDKPFSEVRVGELVVRSRSDTGVCVDTVLRTSALQRLRARYGETFQEFVKNHRVSLIVKDQKKEVPLLNGKGFEDARLVSFQGRAVDQVRDVVNVIHRDLESVLDRDPESPVAKPFEDLAAGEYAVRRRTDDETVLEYAMNDSAVEKAKREYGESFYLMKQRFRAAVEIRAKDTKGASTMYSIRVSAKHNAAQKIVRVLSQYVDGLESAFSNEQDSVKTDQEKPTQITASGKEPTLPVENLPHSDQSKTLSPEERPSSTLIPWEHILRMRSKNSVKVEVSLSELAWLHLISTQDIVSVKKAHGVGIEAGEPELRPVRHPESPPRKARSLIVTGPFSNVMQFCSSLKSIVWKTVGPASERPRIQESPSALPAERADAEPKSEHQIYRVVLESDTPGEENHMTRHLLEYLENTGDKVYGLRRSGRRLFVTGPSPVRETVRGLIQELVNRRFKHMKVSLQPVEQGSSDFKSISSVRSKQFTVGPKGHPDAAMLHGVFGHEGSAVEALAIEAGCTKCDIKSSNVVAVEGPWMSVQNFENALRLRVHKVCDLGGYQRVAVIERRLVPPRDRRDDENSPSMRRILRKAAELGDEIKMTSRVLTHPVAVVTSQLEAQGGKRTDAGQGARAVTVSSFNTVTLHPQPVISFNLKTPSRTWDAIRTTNDLRIHLLEASSAGAALAHVFTRPYEEPEEGFRLVQEMGFDISYLSDFAPPHISSRDTTVLVQMRGHLLAEKCVQVGDHIVAVARVVECTVDKRIGEGTELISGLAYGNRAYRGGAEQIQPSEIPQSKSQPPAAKGKEEESEKKEPISPGSKEPEANLYRDPVYSALRATRDAAIEGRFVHAQRFMNLDDDSVYDRNAQIAAENLASSSSAKTWRSGNLGKARLAESEAAVSKPASPRLERGRKRPNGLSDRRPSLAARKTKSPNAPQKQAFSTTSRRLEDGKSKEDEIARVVEPSALKMNVADFLGVPEDNKPWKPSHFTRALMDKNEKARRAENRLQKYGHTLDKETHDRLERLVRENDREIDKKLARNAADFLRIMLDKGRVDFRRARFFESAIEKGQAVLLEEAKVARQMAQQGKMDQKEFQKVKQELEETHAILVTETNRLRQFVDEEGETTYDDVDDGSESTNPFDGFRGNR